MRNNRIFRILIAENDEDEQLFIKEGFEKSGLFEILQVASDGQELISWLQKERDLPDAIISDLNMPGKNGYDVIRFVKNTPGLSHIPVFIISTSSTPSNRQKCLTEGAASYLVKPDTFMEYVPFAGRLYEFVDEIVKGS